MQSQFRGRVGTGKYKISILLFIRKHGNKFHSNDIICVILIGIIKVDVGK